MESHEVTGIRQGYHVVCYLHQLINGTKKSDTSIVSSVLHWASSGLWSAKSWYLTCKQLRLTTPPVQRCSSLARQCEWQPLSCAGRHGSPWQEHWERTSVDGSALPPSWGTKVRPCILVTSLPSLLKNTKLHKLHQPSSKWVYLNENNPYLSSSCQTFSLQSGCPSPGKSRSLICIRELCQLPPSASSALIPYYCPVWEAFHSAGSQAPHWWPGPLKTPKPCAEIQCHGGDAPPPHLVMMFDAKIAVVAGGAYRILGETVLFGIWFYSVSRMQTHVLGRAGTWWTADPVLSWHSCPQSLGRGSLCPTCTHSSPEWVSFLGTIQTLKPRLFPWPCLASSSSLPIHIWTLALHLAGASLFLYTRGRNRICAAKDSFLSLYQDWTYIGVNIPYYLPKAINKYN